MYVQIVLKQTWETDFPMNVSPFRLLIKNWWEIMISNRLAMFIGTRNIVYTSYELQLQANNEFITAL